MGLVEVEEISAFVEHALKVIIMYLHYMLDTQNFYSAKIIKYE